jgi:uncharacterized membrane protein HdeD (DUF308 family)
MDNKNERYYLLFGGIASLVMGLLLFTQTTAALSIVMLLVGLAWFIHGVFRLVGIFIDKAQWGWKLFSGVIGVAAGLLVLRNPIESTVVIPALYAILWGIFGILIGGAALIGAFRGEGWGQGIFGAITLIIGLLFIFNAAVAGAVLVWLTALLLVIQGVLGIFFSFRQPKTATA